MENNEIKIGFWKANYKAFILLLVYFTLFLFVSTIIIILLTKPTGTTTIPAVTGHKFSVVYNRIISRELKPEVTFFETDDIEDGIIIKQYPSAGMIRPRESRMKLTVSRNTAFIEVPQLEGNQLFVVKNKLNSITIAERSVSLPIGVITYYPSDKEAENIVVKQSPKAGQRVPLGTRVNLLVSLGQAAPDAKIPDLVNQTIDLCFDLLMSKGVQIDETLVPAASAEQSGLIIEQNPPAGTILNPGDVVKLKIAVFKTQAAFYNSYETFSYKLSNSDPAGHYEIVIKDDISERIRYSKKAKGGDLLTFAFFRTGNAKAVITVDKKYLKSVSMKTDDF